jgi:hypothetical protein
VSEWPAPVAEQALHGPAGGFVLRTEAHPMALLSQFLVAFGCACGRGAHYQVEADRHYSNEFVVLVGPQRQDGRAAPGATSAACSGTQIRRLGAAWSAASRPGRV